MLATLRAITWNLWFNEWQRELRQQALWAEIAARRPAVVCLQEVRPDHLAGPELRAWQDRGYWVSDEQIDDYDVLILSRRPVLSFERLALPSVMSRQLLVARLAVDPPLTVATVHLESTDAMTTSRCRQLADIIAFLADEPEVLLMGDMNFPAGDTPEAALLVGWTDAWPLCHPGDPGFTVDTAINEMRAAIKPGDKQARIDRVFYRGERWRIAAIERLGMTPFALDPPFPPVFVSDHFGLQVDLAAR